MADICVKILQFVLKSGTLVNKRSARSIQEGVPDEAIRV